MGNLEPWVREPTQWRSLLTGATFGGAAQALAHDWSETNLPWAYTDTAQFTADWPAGVTIVDIQTGSTDFHTNLQNTVNTAGKRVVVRLGEGVYHLDEFRMIGDSGSPTYSFGFFAPNLQGFVGKGPDKTFVQMDADSMSQDQIDEIQNMPKSGFNPLLMGMCRLDGTSASPVLLAGLTFRSADQQMMTSKAPDQDIVVPQPAPHNGVILYATSPSRISYTRFQAAGRACRPGPPFETANIGSQYAVHYWHHVEFDGRRSPDLDPAQPRRCGPLMINNETIHHLSDSWLHHSNVSRYAANDENRDTAGVYTVLRCKAEHISDNQNRDPALNGGKTLGAHENATPFGWESTNGTINVEDCIISQDNTQAAPGYPMHLQLTPAGARNPAGGRLYVKGGAYLNPGVPLLDGFVCIRIGRGTHWWLDGVENTCDVRLSDGTKLAAAILDTGSWPPPTIPAEVTPQTHYIVRGA